MEGFKFNLFAEQEYLDSKITKLEKFVLSDEFKKLNFRLRWLTKLQYSYMKYYFNCLTKRIALLCTIDDLEEYANSKHVKEEVSIVEEKPKKKKKLNKKEEKDA